METRKIKISVDDYNIVQVTKDTLELDEDAALSFIMEIGLFNILNYPSGIKEVDAILSGKKYQLLIKRIKAVWKI